jgi:hypothetical protein
MKDKDNENEIAENMKKEEMELDEDGLSKKWKLFNVLMVGLAFMLIFTGRDAKNNNFWMQIFHLKSEFSKIC